MGVNESLVITMSMTGRERRLLAEIERALAQEDPQYVERIAAINRVQAGESSPPAENEAAPWIERRAWLLLLAALTVITLLMLAALTA